MRDQDFKLHITVVAWLHILEAVLYIGGAILLMAFLSSIGLMAHDPAAAYFGDGEETRLAETESPKR